MRALLHLIVSQQVPSIFCSSNGTRECWYLSIQQQQQRRHPLAPCVFQGTLAPQFPLTRTHSRCVLGGRGQVPRHQHTMGARALN